MWHYCKGGTVKPVSNESYTYDYHEGNDIPDSLREVIQLVGTLPKQNPVALTDISDLDLGLDYPWDTPRYQVGRV